MRRCPKCCAALWKATTPSCSWWTKPAACWAQFAFPNCGAPFSSRIRCGALVVAGDLLGPQRASVTEDDDLDLALRVLGNEDVEELPVVERGDPRKLAGAIRKRDVLAAYQRELMRRDLAGGFGSAVAVVDRVHQVDLGGGYVVQELLAPRAASGKSLRELDLRARAGVQVLLIRSPEPALRPVCASPGPLDVIASGDRLIVAGPKPAVDAMAGRS